MLDSFFIYGNLPPDIEKGEYNYWLVTLSYAVAVLASYTALSLTSFRALHLAQIMAGKRSELARRITNFSGAMALGVGIWAMHFIGMLAYRMRMRVEYDPLITLASLLAAVVVAYGVLAKIDRKQLLPRQIAFGAILLGLGICAMHYNGMAAMKMDADVRYLPVPFFFSVAIAIVASGSALWLAFTLSQYKSPYQHRYRILAALVMGGAICGMHYMGLEASVFIPFAQCRYDPNQSFNVLAGIIALLTTPILLTTLTLSYMAKKNNLQEPTDTYAFPVKLLALSMILTLGVVLWMGGNSLYIHRYLTHNIAKDQHLAELADEILYLDSVNIESARGLFSTGDAEFDARYNQAPMPSLNKK